VLRLNTQQEEAHSAEFTKATPTYQFHSICTYSIDKLTNPDSCLKVYVLCTKFIERRHMAAPIKGNIKAILCDSSDILICKQPD